MSIAPIANGPTMAQTFMTGFLRGSMLQMAVCAPPRQAVARPIDAVLIARLGRRSEARAQAAPEPAPAADGVPASA